VSTCVSTGSAPLQRYVVADFQTGEHCAARDSEFHSSVEAMVTTPARTHHGSIFGQRICDPRGAAAFASRNTTSLASSTIGNRDDFPIPQADEPLTQPVFGFGVFQAGGPAAWQPAGRAGKFIKSVEAARPLRSSRSLV